MSFFRFTNHLLTTYFACVLLTFFSSCNEKKDIPFEVTYEVELLTDIPIKLLISYQDSSEYVTFYTTEKSFLKKVTLPSENMASLCVSATYNWDSFAEYLANTPQWLFEGKQKYYSISGKIVHPDKTVMDTSKNIIQLTLMRSECIN